MKKNIFYGIILSGSGSLWWGTIGVFYFKLASFVGPIELVIHRTIWTAFSLIITISLFSKWKDFLIIMIKQDIIEKKKENFVDIILPNYNKDKYLEECINSIISQTYDNWKLYIIDDDSKDNSKKIINKFKNSNIINTFLYKNKGVAFCRNLGIRLSNSKYISFIDSDDYWTQTKLEEQIAFMEKFNHVFTFTDYTSFVVKNDSKILEKKIVTPDSFNYDQFINNTSISMSSIIIRRSILGTIKFPSVDICEDYSFKCELLKKGNIAVKCDQNSMFYRISKNSLQSNKFKNLYWVWNINKKYNQLTFIKNLKSLLCIIISSIKRYGIK